MRRILMSLVVLLQLFSLIFVISDITDSDLGSIPLDGNDANDSTRSQYPVWTIGDSYNYTQTYYDTSLYSSYTYWTNYEVMNLTTVSTPEGTFTVYGVKGTGHSAWEGIWPVSDGYFYYNSTNYYNASDKAFVESYSRSSGANYYLNGHTYYKPPVDHWDYPVQENESWNVTTAYHYSNSGVVGGNPHNSEGDYSYTTNYSCIARCTTTVNAGTFSTLKIRTQSDPNSYSIHYFDQEMGWYVKFESYVNGDLNTVYELNRTTFVHGPAVNPDSFDLSMREDAVDSTSLNLTDIFTGPGSLNYSAETQSVMNVTISNGGQVTFRPRKNWHGSVKITFRADDGRKNSTKDVTVTVTAVNDPPHFDPLPDITILEGGSDSSLDLDDYINDVDNDIEDVTFYVVQGERVDATLLQGNLVRFHSPGNWYGEDYIGVKAKDNDIYSNTETIRVIVLKVNDPPTITALSDRTVSQYGYLNLTLEATDPDFEETVALHTNISEAIEGISEWTDYSLDPVTGEFMFHPVEEELVGSHAVSFWADDGTARDYENITITVENVNDLPVVESNFTYIVLDPGEKAPDDTNTTVRFTSPTVFDQDGDEVVFTWDFGDGSDDGYGGSLNHTYSKFGNYTVSVEISDGIMEDPFIQKETISLLRTSDPQGDDDDEDDDDTDTDDDDDDDETGDDDEDDDDTDDTGHGDDDGGGDDDDTDTGDDVEPGDDDDTNGNGHGGTSGTDDLGSSEFPAWLIVVIIFVVLLITAFLIVLFIKMGGKGSSEEEGMDIPASEDGDLGISDHGRVVGPQYATYENEGMMMENSSFNAAIPAVEHGKTPPKDPSIEVSYSDDPPSLGPIVTQPWEPPGESLPQYLPPLSLPPVSESQSNTKVIKTLPIKGPICPNCNLEAGYYQEYDCYWCERCMDYVYPQGTLRHGETSFSQP